MAVSRDYVQEDPLLQDALTYHASEQPFGADRHIAPSAWCHASNLPVFLQYLQIRDAAFRFCYVSVSPPAAGGVICVLISFLVVLFQRQL
jgi:hypothetical protein